MRLRSRIAGLYNKSNQTCNQSERSNDWFCEESASTSQYGFYYLHPQIPRKFIFTSSSPDTNFKCDENHIKLHFDRREQKGHSIFSLFFSPVINNTKKFRRRKNEKVDNLSSSSLRLNEGKKKTTITNNNYGATKKNIDQRFSALYSTLNNCKKFRLLRLIAHNHFIFDRIFIIILLYSTLLIAPLKSYSHEQPQFNDYERRFIRNLFLKKFGLEQLSQHIDEREEHTSLMKSTLTTSESTSSRRRRIPAYVWDAYYDTRFDTIKHYFPTNISAYRLNSDSTINDEINQRYRQYLSFNLTQILSGTMKKGDSKLLSKIEFRVSSIKFQIKCISPNKSSIDKCGRLNLYDKHLNLIDSRKLVLDAKWIAFDIPRYLLVNSDMLNLILEYGIPSNDAIQFDNDYDQALVIFYGDAKRNSNDIFTKTYGKRSKRATGTRAHKRRNHRKHIMPIDSGECKRSSLYVDFGELNWQDWIIAPGYEAYQCRGRCIHPMPSHLNTTNHAIVQSLINSIDPSTASQPACVPVEMSAISILYRDINNVVVVKTYPGMRVEACGCH